MKYRYGIPLLLGILACLCPLQIYADDTLVIDDYINDHANIVDENTEEDLNKLGYRLEQETGAQVVFITEDTLHDQDIRQVAYQTFKKYQLGDKDKDNGILFIVSIEDKLRYMEVGRGLEDVITDIKSQHLQTDYLVPYFQKEDYSTGIKELYTQTVQVIEDHQTGTPVKETEEEDGIEWIMLLPIFAILLGAIYLSTQRKTRSGATLYMVPGQKTTLNIKGYDFESESILVSSQDPSVVSVQPNGEIQAHKTGKTKIFLQKPDSLQKDYVLIIVSRKDHSSRNNEDELLEALLWGSILSGSRRRHYGGGFGIGSGGGGFGGFSGGGGGSSRGGGAGGSW